MTKEIKLLDGTKLSNLGIGSWKMGDSFSKRKEELESIKYALDNGIKLIDTAEMYGNGNSEKLIGEAIKGYDRDDLFLVSKSLSISVNKVGSVIGSNEIISNRVFISSFNPHPLPQVYSTLGNISSNFSFTTALRG